MKILSSILLFSITLFFSTAQAAYIDYNGTVKADTTTSIPWVAGSTMWGAVEDGTGTGTFSSGFASLNGLDISLFTFTFGDLELTSYLSPTSVAGFEYYSEGDGSVEQMHFYYDSNLWASATLNFLQVDVDNKDDTSATGFGTANLSSAGVSNAFFNEVMALTGGSGLLNFDVYDFTPVNKTGDFTSIGRITVSSVPLPAAFWLFAPVMLGIMKFRRKAVMAGSIQ